jgi:glutaminyl-peptide cyclotransferase
MRSALRASEAGILLLAFLAVALASWPKTACAGGAGEVLELRVEVLDELPHNPASFTQGLLWLDGDLYESNGGYGESRLLRVDPATGQAELAVELPESLFGEGLARVDDRLVQLTWRAGTALVYDLRTFEVEDRLSYRGEGWGLCHDGQELVMSDGSSWLTRRDPSTFRELSRVQVTLEGSPVAYLNELECAEGWIYANVYLQDRIVRIAPTSGEVVAVIDASSLRQRLGSRIRRGDALNGIAFRPDTATFLVTGKNWPTLFEVIFVE